MLYYNLDVMKNKKMRIVLLILNSLSAIIFSIFYTTFLINVVVIDARDPEDTLLTLLTFGILTAIFFVSSCVLNFIKVLFATKKGYKKVVIYYFLSILLMPILIGVLVNLYINLRFVIFEISKNKANKIAK